MIISKDLISIIMPAYNAGKYIAQSIQSVLEQTWTDWELLIIDDASTDDTEKIACFYEKFDKRIRFLKNGENMGVARTRNRGVNEAFGEWIAFLDSDDCWEAQKLEKQMRLAKEKKTDFIFTGSTFTNEIGERSFFNLKVPDEIGYPKLLKQNIISCSSVLIRKHLLLEYPMDSRNMHEDFAVWLQILRDKQTIACGINEPLLIYRVTASSKSGNKYKAAIMTFRVFRYIGFGYFSALYYWFGYVLRSIIKYIKIKVN